MLVLKKLYRTCAIFTQLENKQHPLLFSGKTTGHANAPILTSIRPITYSIFFELLGV
jgi:hypothetical protein